VKIDFLMKQIAFFFAFFLWSASLLSQGLSALSASDYLGDMKARHIGPALMSGRISDLEGHPSDSKIIYAGTAGGGVWKSVDGGLEFIPVFDEHCQSIGCVSVDPSDPDKSVWVGTGEVWTRNSVSVGDGIYYSGDGGKSWQNKGLKGSERISAIEIHPKNSNVIYAAVLGRLWCDSEERGVYKSVDKGNTWEKILYVGPSSGCSELMMDPNNPEVLYAAFWEFRRTAYSFNSGGLQSALYKSVDAGKTWTKLQNGLPSGKLGRIAVAVAPSDSRVVYAVVEAEKSEQRGLYRSDDGGQNWKFLNGDFGLIVRPFYFSRICVDPKNPDILIKAGLYGSISRDGGKTFEYMGSMHSDIHDVWFDPNDSQKLFAATDGGVYRSMDGGTKMQIVENMPVSQFYQVSFDQQTPYKVYGGLQDNGSWVGPSSSPGGIEARDWETVGYGDGFRVFPHPLKPEIVYSEMQGAEQIWRYNTSSRQVKNIKPYAVSGDPKLRFNWNTPILTGIHNPDRIYCGSQFLHVSDDQGDTWRKISPDLTTNDKTKQNQESSGGISADNSGAENHCTIFTIAESPLNREVIWVGTDDGMVQVTRDGGKTWTNLRDNITEVPRGTWCNHIELSLFSEGAAYAVFDGHTRGDFAPYIVKTEDFGQHWTLVSTNEIPTFVKCVQEDFVNRNLLYAGTEMGLYVSLDAGKMWSRFNKNLPPVAIHHLELHPKTHDLILATHGRGIVIIDDTRALRELNPEILSASLHFFPSEPFVMYEENSFGGTSTEHQFVGSNPGRDASIKYFLSKRHTFGKMSMEVYDAQNRLVCKLEPGKQKGINTVDWGFNTKSPKVAKGKTMSGGSSFVPRVPAGKYTVRITKGSEVFSQTIETVYDPRSPFSLVERKQQEAVTADLFNFTQDLAYLVYQIDLCREAMSEIQSKQKLTKDQTAWLSVVNEMRNQLVVTSGDNYVGTAEKKLREKLGDIYSTIGGYYGAPSSSQMENVNSLKDDFAGVKEQFEKWKSKAYNKLSADYKAVTSKDLIAKDFKEFIEAE
jgi:photosystem II stability/assembly factor-like uncharacterized protein